MLPLNLNERQRSPVSGVSYAGMKWVANDANVSTLAHYHEAHVGSSRWMLGGPKRANFSHNSRWRALKREFRHFSITRCERTYMDVSSPFVAVIMITSMLRCLMRASTLHRIPHLSN